MAFARLLVRDVSVVVLDEATARMDPVTEARVVRAADRLISGRTGILVAHRLSTTERAEQVAVLESGRVVQQGPRDRLAGSDGPFRRLLEAAAHEVAVEEHHHDDSAIGSVRRSTTPPPPSDAGAQPEPGPAGAPHRQHPAAVGAARRLAVPRRLADRRVRRRDRLDLGHYRHRPAGRARAPAWVTAALVVSLVVGPLLLSQAFRTYPHWWVEVRLRVRAAVLARPDRAAPAGAHPAGRGGGPHDGRRPARALHRPLGRLRQRSRRRRDDRAHRQTWVAGAVLLDRHGRLRARLDAGPARWPGARPRPRRRRAPVRAVPGLGARVGPHGQARRRDPAGARAPARGRRRSRRRRGARAPRPGAARRRARGHGPARRRRRLGRPAARAGGSSAPRCWSPTPSAGSTGSAAWPGRWSPRPRACAPG